MVPSQTLMRVTKLANLDHKRSAERATTQPRTKDIPTGKAMDRLVKGGNSCTNTTHKDKT